MKKYKKNNKKIIWRKISEFLLNLFIEREISKSAVFFAWISVGISELLCIIELFEAFQVASELNFSGKFGKVLKICVENCEKVI